ncbi:MAG: HNH endonuclease [Chloroflexaceae bacterium]
MSPGYVPEAVQARVRALAAHRCGYCLSRQQFVLGLLEIEHIIPTARGGTDDEENLWLACRLCNMYKGAQTHARDPVTNRRIRLFNPRRQRWSRHFTWSEDGTRIIGRTICGRATVIALQLNNFVAVTVRHAWVTAGWHPPED